MGESAIFSFLPVFMVVSLRIIVKKIPLSHHEREFQAQGIGDEHEGGELEGVHRGASGYREADGGGTVSKIRLEQQIRSIENTIAYLKDERKDLNKKIIANRQSLATYQNILRELKAKRRQADE